MVRPAVTADDAVVNTAARMDDAGKVDAAVAGRVVVPDSIKSQSTEYAGGGNPVCDHNPSSSVGYLGGAAPLTQSRGTLYRNNLHRLLPDAHKNV